jgi:hypothetical protein
MLAGTDLCEEMIEGRRSCVFVELADLLPLQPAWNASGATGIACVSADLYASSATMR